jgi:hypothetical protein
MVAVPAEIPVTTPVEEFTVATELSELDHVPPETVEEKVVVLTFGDCGLPPPSLQILWLPLREPAEKGLTTITPLELAEVPPEQPTRSMK